MEKGEESGYLYTSSCLAYSSFLGWLCCALALCTVINKYTVLYLADFTDSSMHRKPFSDAPLPLYVALNISDTEGACLNVNVI